MSEAIAAQRGEYVFGTEDGRLAVSGEQLEYVGPGEDETDADRIPIDEVTHVGTAVDKSVSGFRTIGVALGLFALLFTGLAVQMALAGAELDVVTVGTGLSAGFGWLGAVQYYRADRGTFRVIAVRTDDGEHVYYTQRDDDAVDRLARELRSDGSTPEADTSLASA